MLLRAWKAAAARKRATRLLTPYAERAAWAGHPTSEAEWLASGTVGFLAGAIGGIVARDNLDTEGLAAIQLGVWEDLTGTAPDLFATRLYLLSSEDDIDLRAGRDAGERFAAALLAGEEEIASAAWDTEVTGAYAGHRGGV